MRHPCNGHNRVTEVPMQVEQVRAPPDDLLDEDDELPRTGELKDHHVGGEDLVLLTAGKLELLLIWNRNGLGLSTSRSRAQ